MPPLLIHIHRGQQRLGPFSLEQVNALVSTKQLFATDLAWHDGMGTWQPLQAVATPRGIIFPPGSVPGTSASSTQGLEWIIPINRSALAVAAGYAGLFTILVFPAPIALILGLLAFRDFKNHPEKRGRGRAWFGTIAGGIVTLLFAFFLIAGALSAPTR